MRTYYFNEHKQQLEIYKDNMLDIVISEVYSEEEAKRLFEESREQ
jgi:hypothetical protein